MNALKLSQNADNNNKVNFLARTFGLFSEEIVELWCRNDSNTKFNYIGKPSIKVGNRKIQLDHCLQSKKEDKKNYIVEQKSLYAYSKGKIAVINSDDNDSFINSFEAWSNQKLKHQKSNAWEIFLNFKSKPYHVYIGKEEIEISGNILIWSSGTPEGIKKLQKKIGVTEILLLDDMTSDLIKWGDSNYYKMIHEKKSWIDELFSELNPLQNDI